MERAFNVTPRQWQQDWVSYNVAPSQPVPVVRMAGEVREGVMLRWGLIPHWAKGEVPRYSTINARAETIESAATYRSAWRRGQRCILPVLGFYEWQVTEHGKQPYFIRMAGGEPFALAGLWDASRNAEGEVVESCTVITMAANALLARIHHKGRMPALLTPDTCAPWLEGDPDDARSALAPFPADRMDAYPVSTRVNSPRNNDPDLLTQVA